MLLIRLTNKINCMQLHWSVKKVFIHIRHISDNILICDKLISGWLVDRYICQAPVTTVPSLPYRHINPKYDRSCKIKELFFPVSVLSDEVLSTVGSRCAEQPVPCSLLHARAATTQRLVNGDGENAAIHWLRA